MPALFIMNKHEIKNCPRCQASFECKPGDITHCQCFGIRLPADLQDEIAHKFADCLCRNCLLELKREADKTIPE
jgi:hypothetical protein